MKLSVLALNYDRTIASANEIDPSVRVAIVAARARGILVLLTPHVRQRDKYGDVPMPENRAFVFT